MGHVLPDGAGDGGHVTSIMSNEIYSCIQWHPTIEIIQSAFIKTS